MKEVPTLVLVGTACARDVFSRHGYDDRAGFFLPDASQDKTGGGYVYLPVSTQEAAEEGDSRAYGTRLHEVSHAAGYRHIPHESSAIAKFRQGIEVGFDARALGTWRLRPRAAPRDVLDLNVRCLAEWRRPGSPKVVVLTFASQDPNRWRWKD